MELLRKIIVQTVYTILFLLIVWTNGLCQNADDVSKIVITKEPRFGYMTWKIQAANGIWHYEIEKLENGEPGTGFSSAIDQSGNDWIGNDCVGRREWRGWPNFGSDGFGHPCRGGSGKSRWLDSDGNQIEFDKEYVGEYLILESWNEKFRLWYHFFPSHVAIQVFEAQDLYSFLWEGPIAGEMNLEQQYYVLEDGKKRRLPYNTGLGYLEPEFGRNFPSPFFYFIDDSAEQIVYIGVKDQSEGGDEGWCQPNNMVIFSFGREDDKRALSGTDAICVFGFLNKNIGHDEIRRFIVDRLDNPFHKVH